MLPYSPILFIFVNAKQIVTKSGFGFYVRFLCAKNAALVVLVLLD